MSDYPGIPAAPAPGLEASASPYAPTRDPMDAGEVAHTAFRVLPLLLGVGGLLPFIAFALMVLSPTIDSAHRGGRALIAYGACILSFLGAVHWGFALAVASDGSLGTRRAGADRARLVLGVVPALFGTAAILVQGLIGLLILMVGFAGVQLAEERANHLNLVPRGYIWLRRLLTIIVLAMLVTVVTLRLLGQAVLD